MANSILRMYSIHKQKPQRKTSIWLPEKIVFRIFAIKVALIGFDMFNLRPNKISWFVWLYWNYCLHLWQQAKRKRLRLAILWEKYCEKRHASFLFLKTWEIFKTYKDGRWRFPRCIAWVCCLLPLYVGFSQDLQKRGNSTQFHAWADDYLLLCWKPNIFIGNYIVMIPYSSR